MLSTNEYEQIMEMRNTKGGWNKIKYMKKRLNENKHFSHIMHDIIVIAMLYFVMVVFVITNAIANTDINESLGFFTLITLILIFSVVMALFHKVLLYMDIIRYEIKEIKYGGKYE